MESEVGHQSWTSHIALHVRALEHITIHRWWGFLWGIARCAADSRRHACVRSLKWSSLPNDKTKNKLHSACCTAQNSQDTIALRFRNGGTTSPADRPTRCSTPGQPRLRATGTGRPPRDPASGRVDLLVPKPPGRGKTTGIHGHVLPAHSFRVAPGIPTGC